MRSVDEISRELDFVDKEIVRGCFNSGREIDTIALRRQREVLVDELKLARCVLVASDDELDIYEEKKFTDHYIYHVVLHDTCLITGFISADYTDGPHVIGNIGYETFRKYRGHGYTKKALELLCDVFLDKGMEMSVIVIRAGNVPSVKTTEGFGGVLVKSAGTSYGTNVYNVDIRQKVLSRQKLK